MRAFLSSVLFVCQEAVIPTYDSGLRTTLLEMGAVEVTIPLAQPVAHDGGTAQTDGTSPPVSAVLSADTQALVSAGADNNAVAREVTKTEGRYLLLPWVDNEQDCEAMNWVWGNRWVYAALHVGPTSPHDEYTLTTAYHVVQSDKDAKWLNCAYLTGDGPWNQYSDHELELDYKPPESQLDKINECKLKRGDGPVKVCIFPTMVSVVYQYAIVVVCSVLWFACCMNRRRVVSPNVVDCECNGARCCGNNATDTVEGFKDVGFCNCVGNLFCCCCAMAQAGGAGGIRGVVTAIEFCSCCV